MFAPVSACTKTRGVEGGVGAKGSFCGRGCTGLLALKCLLRSSNDAHFAGKTGRYFHAKTALRPLKPMAPRKMGGVTNLAPLA